MSNVRTRRFLAVVCAGVLALAGCTKGPDSNRGQTAPPQPPTGTGQPPPQTGQALPAWLGFNAALVVECGQNRQQDTVRHYRLNQNGAQSTSRADLADAGIIWYDGPTRTADTGCFVVLGFDANTAVYIVNPVPNRQALWTLGKIPQYRGNIAGAENGQIAIVLVWSSSDIFFQLPSRDGYITGLPPGLA
jgi:hypothetical protein